MCFDRPKSEFSEIDEDTGLCVLEVLTHTTLHTRTAVVPLLSKLVDSMFR